jgi:2-methylcitrate dehydratase PrpD
VGYTDNARPEKAVAGLGSVYETMKIGVKPYPACRYTHAAVDGILALMREHHLAAEEIETVSIGLHQNGITLTGAPLAEKRKPRSIVEGQFSMPFAAAVAIHAGQFGWDDYKYLDDPVVTALAARVNVDRDERLEGLRHPFGANVAVTTQTGRFERHIPDPSGEPESFPTAEEITQKFSILATPVLGNKASLLLSELMTIG